MSKKNELEKQIEQAQEAYYNGSEIISDDEYDALIYELEKLDPKNKLLSKIGAEPSSEWKKEKHLIPLGSLDKVNFPHEMEKWISETLDNNPVIVVEKLDGLSIGLQYVAGNLDKGLLRGNSIEGENILVNVLKMQGVVEKFGSNFTGTIRGEIILTKSNHKEYFKDYSNPRNSCAVCRSSDGEKCEYLQLMMYDVIGDESLKTEEDKFSFLKKNRFITPNYELCKTSKEVNDLWQKYQDKTRDSLEYEIDGLVVSCSDLKFQESLGSVASKPKGKMAFKFANQFIKTTVNKITWSVGNTGRIVPICWFDKVNLLGSDIEKASVYNVAYVKKLGLDVGAEVLVCKANEIIPRVEKVVKSTGTTAKIISKCPECDEKISVVGEYLQCTNYDCPAIKVGRIQNWVKELNILELGDALVERLIKSNLVKDVSDLYLLSIDSISSLERMAKKSATNVFNSIWKVNPITLDVFLGGLSIPMIGSSTIRLIMNTGYDSLEKIQNMSIQEIESVKGIGEVKASSLHQGLKSNKDIIDKILKNGVKIKMKNAEGKLSEMKICITGATNIKRAILQEMIVENGGEFKSSITKDTTHLVSAEGEQSTSSKTLKAKKQGIILLSEEQLLAMME